MCSSDEGKKVKAWDRGIGPGRQAEGRSLRIRNISMLPGDGPAIIDNHARCTFWVYFKGLAHCGRAGWIPDPRGRDSFKPQVAVDICCGRNWWPVELDWNSGTRPSSTGTSLSNGANRFEARSFHVRDRHGMTTAVGAAQFRLARRRG